MGSYSTAYETAFNRSDITFELGGLPPLAFAIRDFPSSLAADLLHGGANPGNACPRGYRKV
jgi:hypothetical protein